jgi:predicted MFS family arabinose efflux permease
LIPDLFTGLPADGTAVFTPLSMPLVFSGVVFVLLILAVMFLVEEERPGKGDESWADGFRAVPGMIRTAVSLTRQNNILLLLLGVTSVSGLTLASLESFWQPHFANLFDYSVGETFWFGIIMGGNFIFGVLGNVVITPISKAMGNRYALVAAIFHGVRGVFLIGLALQTNVPAAVALFWLVYMNMGAVNSLHSTLLNEQIPSEQRSSMLSIESLSSYVGGAAGGVLLGYTAEHFSIPTAWLIAGGILVLSLVLYVRVATLQQKERMDQPHGEEGFVL